MGRSRFDYVEAELLGNPFPAILSDRYDRTMAHLICLAIISGEPNFFGALLNWRACSVIDEKRLVAKPLSNAFATRLDRRELALPWAHLSMLQMDVGIKMLRIPGSVVVF